MLAILLLSSPLLAGDNDGLMSYASFLKIRELQDSNIEEKNCETADVLNTRTRDWDSQRRVCELWIREQVTRGYPLKYNDGSQVYRTSREWTEKVMKPDTEPRTGLFMVKQDHREESTVSEFKRYVTNGN